jgi:FKBP-type peptidyl-prolyl cis-trans isomerase SlyD
MDATKDTVVTIDYTLRDDGGEVIDTSEGRDPISFVQGAGRIVPGLEKEIEGHSEGDSFAATIQPQDAYGERRDDLVFSVDRSQIPVEELSAGMQLQAQTEQGTQLLTVQEVEDDTVKLDANHPLAGTTLNFDVTVREVREATAQEVEDGKPAE